MSVIDYNHPTYKTRLIGAKVSRDDFNLFCKKVQNKSEFLRSVINSVNRAEPQQLLELYSILRIPEVKPLPLYEKGSMREERILQATKHS